MAQKQRIRATFEGKEEELEGTDLASEIGQAARKWGLESFEVSATTSVDGNFEQVTEEMLNEKSESVREVRLYRVERAG